MNKPGDTHDALAGVKTDWNYLTSMTDKEAHANALADEDNPPLTDEQLARMHRVPRPEEIRQRLGLTQREFSRRFQIALGTLRDWEQGSRRPDSAAKAYLRVINEEPDIVAHVLHKEQKLGHSAVQSTSKSGSTLTKEGWRL
jgi:putative transcriptional regulator